MALEKESRSQLVKNQSDGEVALDFFLSLGVLGFSFTFAWMLLLFSTSVFSNVLLSSRTVDMFAHIALAFAVVAMLSLFAAFSRTVFILRPALPALTLVFSLANLYITALPPGMLITPVLVGSWAVTGVGFALLIVQWSEFVSVLRVGQSKAFFSFSTLLAVFWVIVFLLMDQSYRMYLVFILSLASLVVLVFLRRYYLPLMEITFIDAKTTISRMQLSWKPLLSTTISSTALGFMLAWFIRNSQAVPYLPLVLSVLLALVLLMMSIDSMRWRKLGENFIMRTFLLYVVIGILPLLFVSGIWQIVCCVVLICGMMISVVQSNSAIAEHINLFKLSPIFAMSFGRSFSYLGILLGYGFGYVAFWTELFGANTMAIVTVFLVVVFAAETIFVMLENHYPIDEGNVEVESMVHVFPSNAAKETAASDGEGGAAVALVGLDDNGRPGIWKRKCYAVAASYGLSSRQREVLLLLGKGRNAEYITNELIISLHTAKAHIYNIYQKLGVHSRQELIDLIEKVQLDA
jgi:DNA-binding CsgD family transcriptional regulator